MQNMPEKNSYILKALVPLAAVVLTYLLIPVKAMAVCPVCTVAVGAGVGLSRWLGIDDTISGLWIGGVILSVSIWLVTWLDKKNINFMFRDPVSFAAMYGLTLIPLYYTGMFTDPFNMIWGMNKLLLGIVLGTVLFMGALFMDKFLRSKNEGKVFVPFQKVILPVGLLLIGSIVFYTITV
jgi:hypothetical protein